MGAMDGGNSDCQHGWRLRPGMGIAQAGMIRRKNSLSMMMQCTSGMAIGSLLWYVVGYSLTFGPDVGGIIGDPWPFLFFRDMPRSTTECLSIAPSIPGPLFASFQIMFALMVPVIVTFVVRTRKASRVHCRKRLALHQAPPPAVVAPQPAAQLLPCSRHRRRLLRARNCLHLVSAIPRFFPHPRVALRA